MRLSEPVLSQTEVASERGVVSAGHRLEAEAGARMLESGGNAVDAVVAAAFTGFAVEPAMCGLGGYGHLAAYLADSGKFLTVDHGPRAPRAAHAHMFELDEAAPTLHYGWPRVAGRRNEWGCFAAAVPGAVAGLCAAHEWAGRLPLAQVLEPAVEAAEAGVEVTWSLLLVIADRLEEIRAMPHAAALLLRDGRPPRAAGYSGAGDRLDTSELAGTLRRIAREGAAGFYTGPVADAIEREILGGGGILTAGDLAEYRPKAFLEAPAAYRGHAYVTANDQVGYEALNILECFPLAGYGAGSVELYHLLAEACGHAFADNMAHYGDPEHAPSPVEGLASPAFAAERAAGIRLDRAAPRPVEPADPWPFERRVEACSAPFAGTTQMSAADARGNMCALITTLTGGFGSLVAVPGTGVVLNNSMLNFDPRPARPNSVAPGKMPFFAVPTLVAARDGRAVLAACGSGGYRIASGVLSTTVHALDLGFGIQAAVDAPRVHCQGDETFVDSRIPEQVRGRLAELGHRVVVQERTPAFAPFACVCAVAADPGTGLLTAGSGPAWSTTAAAL